MQKTIGKGKNTRYEVAKPALGEAKVSCPIVTGTPLTNPVNNAILQLNSQMISPSGSSNNPIKKRFESDMVPFSSISKHIICRYFRFQIG